MKWWPAPFFAYLAYPGPKGHTDEKFAFISNPNFAKSFAKILSRDVVFEIYLLPNVKVTARSFNPKHNSGLLLDLLTLISTLALSTEPKPGMAKYSFYWLVA